MEASYKILNKPQRLRKRVMRESTPFSFKAYLQDIITENERIFKLTTGTIQISGWTRHSRDIDVDCIHLVMHGKVIDIKPQLEYLGAMCKIDEAARNYVKRNYYQQPLKAV